MNTTLAGFLSAIIGYLLGSVSVSILLSRALFHQDIRRAGSGNAGAANTARVFGMGAGVMTFAGDFAKTIIAMLLGKFLGGTDTMCIAGACALIGHCFPLYFHFRGGKAVSAGAAAALMLDWRVFLLAAAAFALAALLSKTASVSSMSAAVAVGVLGAVGCPTLPEKLLAVFACLLVVFMHRSNIRRLIAGTEPKFHSGSKPKK